MTPLRAYLLYFFPHAVGASLYPVFGLLIGFCVAALTVLTSDMGDKGVLTIWNAMDHRFIWSVSLFAAALQIAVPLGAGMLLDWRAFAERIRLMSEAEWKSADLRHRVVGETLRVFRGGGHQ